jgi:hypothetical protein
MLDKLLSKKILSRKIDKQLIILSALILLDAFTFVFFDVIAGSQNGANSHVFNTLGNAGWILSTSNISGIVSGQYSLNFILSSIASYYGTNSFIFNKVVVILISGVVVAAIYRYAPALLPICYGYLLGIAGVGVYDGLQTIGVINSSELSALPFDYQEIPQAIMAIFVVVGGILSLSKVTAYLFSQMVALHIFEDNTNTRSHVPFIGFRALFLDHIFKKTTLKDVVASSKMEDRKADISEELRPDYERIVRELAELDTQNSIEAIQRSYDLVNQMSERFGVDQYQVMYDVYKEKSIHSITREQISMARENAVDKDL